MLGAVLGATNSHVARSYLLTVGGRDVIADPSKRYGVPLDSIDLVEAGSDSVSSMSFVIEDPTVIVGISDGDEVRFHSFLTGAPLFLGYVQGYEVQPAFGEQGRMISVKAIGIEAVLDWAIFPAAITIPTGTTLAAAFQIVLSRAVGLGQLRWGLNTTPFARSSEALPLAASTPALTSDVAITAGMSIRGCLSLIVASAPVPTVGV
jgi:hypothetical protein